MLENQRYSLKRRAEDSAFPSKSVAFYSGRNSDTGRSIVTDNRGIDREVYVAGNADIPIGSALAYLKNEGLDLVWGASYQPQRRRLLTIPLKRYEMAILYQLTPELPTTTQLYLGGYRDPLLLKEWDTTVDLGPGVSSIIYAVVSPMNPFPDEIIEAESSGGFPASAGSRLQYTQPSSGESGSLTYSALMSMNTISLSANLQRSNGGESRFLVRAGRIRDGGVMRILERGNYRIVTKATSSFSGRYDPVTDINRSGFSMGVTIDPGNNENRIFYASLASFDSAAFLFNRGDSFTDRMVNLYNLNVPDGIARIEVGASLEGSRTGIFSGPLPGSWSLLVNWEISIYSLLDYYLVAAPKEQYIFARLLSKAYYFRVVGGEIVETEYSSPEQIETAENDWRSTLATFERESSDDPDPCNQEYKSDPHANLFNGTLYLSPIDVDDNGRTIEERLLSGQSLSRLKIEARQVADQFGETCSTEPPTTITIKQVKAIVEPTEEQEVTVISTGVFGK